MLNTIPYKTANIDNISSFDKFENFLSAFGLPSENVIADLTQRQIVINSLPTFLDSLPTENKRDAYYLSRFVAGAAVGLFDASLNYVWNEVVLHLRHKACLYGLDLFFDEAVSEKLRENYKNEKDLAGLKDKTLLDTCKKLELISDLVYKKLSHILTMRNDIGASHPNSYCINGYELLGWLTKCINDVLSDKPSDASITVKSIVDNIKSTTSPLNPETVHIFNCKIRELSSQMCNNLLSALFNLFTSNNQEKIVRENALTIATKVWTYSSEEIKYNLGERIDTYKARLDSEKLQYAEIFFERCNGKRYYSLDSKIIKISTLCDDLIDAHIGMNNFYHEPPIANEIMSFIISDTDIPKEREEKILKTFLICRIGREVNYNNGVSPSGKNYYDAFFKLLNKEQIITIIKLLNMPEIRNLLDTPIRQHNCKEILTLLKSPLIGDRLNEILDFLIASDNLYMVFDSLTYKDLTINL